MKIHRKLQDGSVTPSQVVVAYDSFMVTAQGTTNHSANVPEDILKQAQYLERRFLRKPKPKLYGVIFSIEDLCDLEGRDSTVGLARYLNRTKDEDCVLIKTLKKLGAIIIPKTGCSESQSSYCLGNPIYDTVNNPNSFSRSANAPFCGEADYLALNGSMAGVASNLRGSVRVPAELCGICSLRPMNGRLSTVGALDSIAGYRGIESFNGLMARDVDFLAECCGALIETEMFGLDPQVPPLAWRPEIYNSQEPLRIGYFVDDGYFTPTPGIKRAVEKAVSALRGLGHTLVPFTDPDPWYMMENYYKLLVHDYGIQLSEFIVGYDIDVSWAQTANHRSTVNSNYAAGERSLILQNHASELMRHMIRALSDVRRPDDVMKTFANRDMYREEFIGEWQEKNLDALICPATGTPALPLAVSPKLLCALSYTMRFNFLDMPAGVVPVTFESETDQDELENYREDDAVYVIARDATRGASGMPIGVQCVALPYQEETALRVMRDVQKIAGREMLRKPPGPANV